MDGDIGSFEIEWSTGKTDLYDRDEFINFLQDYYTSLGGYTGDVMLHLKGLVSKYESLEQLDNQGPDEPNAIILRIIKIRHQMHRLLNYINGVKDEEWGRRRDKYV